MIHQSSSLFFVSIVITTALIEFIRNKKKLYNLAIMFGIIALVFSCGLPVIAAPNLSDLTLDNINQVPELSSCQFEESCLFTGSEFKGLCVAKGQNGSQSDEDIIKAIKCQASDEHNLIVRVDNGAVILSGSVKNERAARTLIQKVEQLPGVHYITVELGLINKNNRDSS